MRGGEDKRRKCEEVRRKQMIGEREKEEEEDQGRGEKRTFEGAKEVRGG